jgi:hypothetical protein
MVCTLKKDPLSLKEAISLSDVELWQGEINDEIDSLESNKTSYLTCLMVENQSLYLDFRKRN